MIKREKIVRDRKRVVGERERERRKDSKGEKV